MSRALYVLAALVSLGIGSVAISLTLAHVTEGLPLAFTFVFVIVLNALWAFAFSFLAFEGYFKIFDRRDK